MNFDETPQEQTFRVEVRAFARDNLPADIRKKVMNLLRVEKNDFTRWQQILHAKGWGTPAWPREYGGPSWTSVQRTIFDEQCFLAGAPRQIPHINMIGPVLQHFGTAAQKARFLPKLARLEEWWCQGYSEPGAGSDLASLQTKATRKGDAYVISGQKIWTTYAHWADWMFALVRTSTEKKRQDGISFILLDMRSPGVRVRPIKAIDGSHEFNEVFLDDVAVPCENLVHEVGKGWTVAKYLLGFERTEIAGVGICKRLLRMIRDLSALETKAGRPLSEDPVFREKIALSEMDLLAHEWTVRRVLSNDSIGQAGGPGPSLLKLVSSQLQQKLTELLMECAGPRAITHVVEARFSEWNGELPAGLLINGLAANYLDWRKITLAGGTTEIQKTLLGKSLVTN
jgi:alkylation response protein AidB-like acyl-CoA dehydrogenase